MAALSRVRATASGGLAAQAESLGGEGGDQHALVVDGHHGVERPAAGAGVVIAATEASGSARSTTSGPVAHGLGQRLLGVRRHHHLDVEAGGGGQEVRGLVGTAGEQEQDAGHARYHGRSTSITRLGGHMSSDAVPEMVLNITEVARQKVLRVRANESEPDKLALWLEIAGVANGKYKYDMYFQPADYAGPTDVVQSHDDLSVVIPAFSVDKVRGATLDVQGDPIEGGLVLDNPNSPSPAVGVAGAAGPRPT